MKAWTEALQGRILKSNGGSPTNDIGLCGRDPKDGIDSGRPLHCKSRLVPRIWHLLCIGEYNYPEIARRYIWPSCHKLRPGTSDPYMMAIRDFYNIHP